jgi:hypothetical protein
MYTRILNPNIFKRKDKAMPDMTALVDGAIKFLKGRNENG